VKRNVKNGGDVKSIITLSIAQEVKRHQQILTHLQVPMCVSEFIFVLETLHFAISWVG